MTKSPRPNVTRNLSHARGPARCYKNFQARSPARPGVLRPEPGPSPNGLRARAGLATSTAHLRAAYKINSSVLHPGNNKQSVPLALALFHESTISALRLYLPKEEVTLDF